jgi:glycosyltransferase involved in cell wall biosynthesis
MLLSIIIPAYNVESYIVACLDSIFFNLKYDNLIEVVVTDDTNEVYVKFSGFDDDEDAAEYADFLASTLPLLLFETTRIN